MNEYIYIYLFPLINSCVSRDNKYFIITTNKIKKEQYVIKQANTNLMYRIIQV